MPNNIKVFIEESEKFYKTKCLDLIKSTSHCDPDELDDSDKKLYWCFIGKCSVLNELKKLVR